MSKSAQNSILDVNVPTDTFFNSKKCIKMNANDYLDLPLSEQARILNTCLESNFDLILEK